MILSNPTPVPYLANMGGGVNTGCLIYARASPAGSSKFFDWSLAHNTPTTVGTPLNSPTSPWGGNSASLSFDGSSVLKFPNIAAYNNFSTNWLSSIQFKRGTTGTRQLLWGFVNSLGANGWEVQFDAANTITMYEAYNSGGNTEPFTTTNAYTDTTKWHQLVIGILSSSPVCLVDGVSQTISGVYQSNITTPAYTLGVGAGGDYTSLYFHGGLDEFIIINSPVITAAALNFQTRRWIVG